MRNRLFILSFFISILFSVSSYGQARLSIQGRFFDNDTLALDRQIYRTNLVVRNTGNRDFLGGLNVLIAADTTGFGRVDTLVSIAVEDSLEIKRGEFKVEPVQFAFNSLRFIDGGVVVVWPVGLSINRDTVLIDSLRDTAVIEIVPDGNPKLEVKEIRSGLPDTARLGDTLELIVVVQNEGDLDARQRAFFLKHQTEGIAESEDSTLVQTEGLLAKRRNELLVPLKLAVNESQFNRGGNVIVVWPVGLGLTPDSLRDTLYVDWKAGIGEKQVPVHIYPMPFQTEFQFEFPQKIEFECVRIFDANGREVPIEITDERVRLTKPLPTGMYFLEIRTTSGDTFRKRLISLSVE